MKRLKQWINWRPEPLPNGKIAKKPCLPSGLGDINSQNPKNWLTYDQAKSNSDKVGFVLTANDPYFCVDLDDSFVDGAWSQHCINVSSWFPGAYQEVSFSGTGLHIFGICNGELPQHRKKSRPGEPKIELYTTGRFMAFSENGATGNYNIDLTDNLKRFIEAVLPPDNITTTDTDYDKPDPEWLGPENDDELIKKMLSSRKSAAALINGRASIHDLWDNVAPVLAETYPDKSRPYDCSAADLALMTHLAFWTGKHLPRMIKLARMSALSREKWDMPRVKDYLTETAKFAIAGCKQVYRDPKQVSEKTALESGDENFLFGPQFLNVTAQVEYFKDCVYILDRNKMFTPHGILSNDQFNAWYAGFTFSITHDGKSNTKKPLDAFINSQGYRFPKVYHSCFRPEYEPGEIITIDHLPCVNTYIPAKITFGNGRVDMFLFLMSKLFPVQKDYDIIINYMSACVQYPGTKFRWCPVIQGVEGNGKTLLMQMVAHGVGKKYSFVVQTEDISNKFNSWIAERLFIIVEEIFTKDRRDIIDTLKPMITNDEVPVQAKKEDTVTVDNKANFGMCTNHKNAIKKTRKDRRYAIIYTPQQEEEHLTRDGLTEKFFKKLTDWLKYKGGWGHVAGYLKRFPIDESLNPATERLRAPETSSTDEAIATSKGIVDQEIEEAIAQGLYGFRNGWISSHALSDFLTSKNLAKFLPPAKRKNALNELGYIPMPWVKNGRAAGQIANEKNTRPVLYIHTDMQYGTPLSTDDYINAQAEN